jgi:hypothetical protein
VINRRRTLAAACGVLMAVLVGCTPGTPTPTAVRTPGPDFTQPGVAKETLKQLLTLAGSTKVLLVRIAAEDVQVSVLVDDKPVTWAFRDGHTSKVASDLQYVDQATFDVDAFNLSDVGSLFRAAAGQCGSSSRQSLTIVDSSGGEVAMSVSTDPESRTVFFNPDGTLTPLLNFDTASGVSAGIRDVLGQRSSVYSVSVISDQGVTAEFPSPTGSDTLRRTRGAKVPVITTTRSGSDLRPFAASRINPAAVWRVVTQARGQADIGEDSKWSVTIDSREKLAAPRMYFSFGFTVVVADIDGTIIR